MVDARLEQENGLVVYDDGSVIAGVGVLRNSILVGKVSRLVRVVKVVKEEWALTREKAGNEGCINSGLV